MLKMKPKPMEVPAPSYVPNGQVKCTLTERRNGWDDSSLTQYLKDSMEHVPFCKERLERAQYRLRLCESVLKDFREMESPGDAQSAKKRSQLERDLMEAAADAMFALGQFDVATEAAA